VVRELAQLREELARERNVPRNRIIKDDALLEIASSKPKDMHALGKSRLLMREGRKGDLAEALLAAIKRGVNTPPEDCPEPKPVSMRKPGNEGLSELH